MCTRVSESEFEVTETFQVRMSHIRPKNLEVFEDLDAMKVCHELASCNFSMTLWLFRSRVNVISRQGLLLRT